MIKNKKGLELKMQGKQGQISRVRRLILEAEFWADWSGKEVKGIEVTVVKMGNYQHTD